MDFPNRKNHRLKNWDYSQNGYYYVTVCTYKKKNLLATVGNAVPGVPCPIVPTEIGKIVRNAWSTMSIIDKNIKTDSFCLMPNHIHGIIIIENQPPDIPVSERRPRRSLHDLIRGFKSAATREYNKLVREEMRNKLWQSSFYDEIIRNEQMLMEIRRYIEENPQKWQIDELYSK